MNIVETVYLYHSHSQQEKHAGLLLLFIGVARTNAKYVDKITVTKVQLNSS